ncbi:MAG: NAD+ synthase [Deltaproteobacteria bacterium]|nr:MAG: NAD+ synthase [Deltaproteobacteria bacterium]
MARTLRLGLAQINPTVGDLSGNVEKILEFAAEAERRGVDLLAFPELVITGYPPEDLLLKPGFIQDNLKALKEVVAYTEGKEITLIVGFVNMEEDLYNAAAIVHGGEVRGIYHKTYLPNYGVFDEERYFKAGSSCPVFLIRGVKVGVTICEDIFYPAGPALAMVHGGAELIVNINASPYHAGKRESRERMLAVRASDGVVVIAYVNMVGGQDELVFDGYSTIWGGEGRLLARGKGFEEDLVIADLYLEEVFRARLHDPRLRKERSLFDGERVSLIPVIEESSPPRSPITPSYSEPMPLLEEIYSALVLGTRDYVRKNGFEKVVIGLSGGIDSSLVATIATDALGKENVVGVAMPSRYSSEGSVKDAERLAQNLGIEFKVISIEPAFKAYLEMLAPHFQGTSPGVAEENIQARIRGNILMALSNKFGWLVLTTGNKSETACGYATLYGDMAGGFAVIKDVPKTLVYELARWRNGKAGRDLIPESILKKPPSAELRPDQKDTDTLPPYDVLDPILKKYVEEDLSLEALVSLGFEEEVVRRVIGMVDRNEYKRRQAPPGIKITHRAFGKDRRLPITNRYRG